MAHSTIFNIHITHRTVTDRWRGDREGVMEGGIERKKNRQKKESRGREGRTYARRKANEGKEE